MVAGIAKLLLPGDTAPNLVLPSLKNPKYVFDQAAGRYIVLCFFHSARHAESLDRLKFIHQQTDLFDDVNFTFFGATTDPQDADQQRIAERYPGYRYFLDYEQNLSRLYGVAAEAGDENRPPYVPCWYVIDPGMRVMTAITFKRDGEDKDQLLNYLKDLPLPPSASDGLGVEAPILMLPRVFEPAFCDELIDLYHRRGGKESGFMIERDGKTVAKYDNAHKNRQDYWIEEKDIIKGANIRIHRRIVPQVRKAYQFNVSRIERHIVARYGADSGGHFMPHRDNTTPATQHRRFAISINLNDDFEGGTIAFPEYGMRYYKPPKGAAVIFSCSLLHTVCKVTSGERFAFLPFLYDDAAAEIRQANLDKLVKDDETEKAEQDQ